MVDNTNSQITDKPAHEESKPISAFLSITLLLIMFATTWIITYWYSVRTEMSLGTFMMLPTTYLVLFGIFIMGSLVGLIYTRIKKENPHV